MEEVFEDVLGGEISEFLFFSREVKARRASRDAAPRRGRGGGGRGGGGRERGVWR